MSVIRDLCDRVVVLESGRVVEEGAVIDVFVRPRSPVTRSRQDRDRPSGRPARAAGPPARGGAIPGRGAPGRREGVMSDSAGQPPFPVRILTLFPEMFPGPLAPSLAGKALARGAWVLETRDITDFARDKDRNGVV